MGDGVVVELGAADGAIDSVLLQPASALAVANEAIRRMMRMMSPLCCSGVSENGCASHWPRSGRGEVLTDRLTDDWPLSGEPPQAVAALA